MALFCPHCGTDRRHLAPVAPCQKCGGSLTETAVSSPSDTPFIELTPKQRIPAAALFKNWPAPRERGFGQPKWTAIGIMLTVVGGAATHHWNVAENQMLASRGEAIYIDR